MTSATRREAIYVHDTIVGNMPGQPRNVTVRPIKEVDAPAWDRLVFSLPDATFFHRAGWRRIFSDVFHLNTHYLVAERGDEITGVLPLVHQSSLLFGSELSAAPFCVEGGPIAKDIESRDALLAAAIGLRETLHADYLEFRSRKARHAGAAIKRDLYATFAGPITTDANKNLLSISRKQRAVIRKTLQGPLTSETDAGIEQFYRVYSESVRNLGTPIFPKRHFSSLLQVFSGDSDIVVVRDGAKPVASVLSFYFRDTVLPYYGGGTREARRSGANDFLYWEVIRRAAERGFTRFDFGRSKAGTGAFAFKKNWGFTPQWLEYEYWLKPGTSLPNKSPNNPRYRLLVEAWKRLPLPVANALGPLLARSLG